MVATPPPRTRNGDTLPGDGTRRSAEATPARSHPTYAAGSCGHGPRNSRAESQPQGLHDETVVRTARRTIVRNDRRHRLGARCAEVSTRCRIIGSLRRPPAMTSPRADRARLKRRRRPGSDALARQLLPCRSGGTPMLALLDIGLAFVLTATLLTVATVLAAFQLGRLVTRDDEQCQVEATGASRIPGCR